MSYLEASEPITPNDADNPYVSVIIPVYNLEKQIPRLLKLLRSHLNLSLEYEIIMVNDGSTDNSLDIIKEEQKSDNHIILISYTPNKGKGHAIKTGVLNSKGNVVMLLDGDCEISVSKINAYLDQINNFDLIIGSKRHPLSNVSVPLPRIILSRLFNILVRLATGVESKDTQVGLKLGNGSLFRRIFNYINTKGYAFDVELLTLAKALNLNVKDMPVDIKIDHNFPLSKISGMLLDMTVIAYRCRISGWYKKQFTAYRESTQRLQ